jgi:4,5-dihydroxyphthalate decarboxylase
MNLELSIALTANPRTWPVLDGRVKPEGIDLVITRLTPSEMFWRQLKFAEFDASEMSFSSLIMAIAAGDRRWVGIPVFTTRRFFHASILARRDVGIESPADLKGKRVGVPEYQQTAALWTRGALEHEFGVTPRDLEHWMERVPSHSHRGAVGFETPAGVTIRQIPPEKNIGGMMQSGELHAAVHYTLPAPNLIDRSRADLWSDERIKPLFPDPAAECARYYRKTGLYPINHGMVVKREIAERHPWVVLNLLDAFNRANDIAERERVAQAEYHAAAGLLGPGADKGLRTQIIRHGVKANRLVLETAARYSEEQGLTPRVVKLEEVFAGSTLDQ